MGIAGRIMEGSQELFVSLGVTGLFILAFIESSFFVVPPDLVLIALSLTTPELSLFYALVTTLGSVLGAIFGYYMGYRGGRPLLERTVSERNIERVQNYFDRYGVMAVAVAGFSPIPYKVFTISSGVFELDRKGFIVASTLSRGARFFIEAALVMLYGQEIVSFLKGRFGIVTVLIAGAAFLTYLVWKKYY